MTSGTTDSYSRWVTRLAALVILVALIASPGCDIGFGQEASGERPEDAVDEDAEITVVGEPDASGLVLMLPTANDALLHGREGEFYQALDMTIPGLRPQGWMGGQYGFVRNQARTPAGPVFTRVHQGVDIRPVHRDARGIPQDTVLAIDAGRVVHVNRSAGASSYGIYVVVEHDWDDSPVYSLMAHLATAWVRPGDIVEAGAPVGRMGYTGAGLARHRAHLHLEVAFMLNQYYQPWHNRFFGSPNQHGLFMGRNLMGVDPAELFLALDEDPDLRFKEFVRTRPEGYRVALPGRYPLDILRRHPWLGLNGASVEDAGAGGSWEISFTREGVPIGISRGSTAVPEPRVVFVADEIRRQHLSTGGYVLRGSNGYRLSRNGLAYMALLAAGPHGVPNWF